MFFFRQFGSSYDGHFALEQFFSNEMIALGVRKERLIYGEVEPEDGNGFLPGEGYTIKVWSKINETETELSLFYLQGPDHFEKDALTVAEINTRTEQNKLDVLGITVHPNPASEQLVFELNLPSNQKELTIEVYDVKRTLIGCLGQ